MTRTASVLAALIAIGVGAGSTSPPAFPRPTTSPGGSSARHESRGLPAAPLPRGRAAEARAVIPFELATRHILVPVTINGSRPLSFLLDTGANVAIVRTDVARELGLKLEGGVTLGGAGAGTQVGQFVRRATWSLVGLGRFEQPVTLALPLPELQAALGRPLDGIIGGEFIKQFVIALDYEARRLTVHDRGAFRYTGPGEAIPIEFVDVTHPVIRATVTPAGGKPTERRFLFDIGSGLALALHSPFVAEQQLLGSGVPTVRAVGGVGAGGRTLGRLGRVDALQIGPYTFERPIAMFSQDRAGAFANAALAGNIGAQIAMRFRLYLDYGRQRIIFEPSPRLAQPFDRAFSGIALRAQGDGFRTVRVVDVLENSAATDADIRVGDVVLAVDDAPIERLTLPVVNEMFERPVPYRLTIARGAERFTVTLTPRRMI